MNKAWPKDLLEGLHRDGIDVSTWSDEEGASFLLSPEVLHRPEVYRYVAFLKQMHELCLGIAEVFDARSPEGSFGSKSNYRHLGATEPLYIANALYILDSYDVPGALLECGVSHGFSSCCLSHACRRLNRTLVCADSFEGLPETRPDEPFFREGDYAAGLGRVQENIRNLGCIDSVQFVQGWYKDSLNGWADPVCLLWMDVDLYESARDVLTHIGPVLAPEAPIFTHEFTDFHGTEYLPGTKTVPGALYEFMDRGGEPHRAEKLMRYFGVFGRTATVQFESSRFLTVFAERLFQQDVRWRKYDELVTCNTVRTAFRLKRLLRLGRGEQGE